VLANFKTALAVRQTKQADLAARLKITQSVLSEIIHGRRRPTADLRTRIAAELGVDESWLFATQTKIPGAHPITTTAPAVA
jgi:transcriptional regulator with XRE-family HTH domain